MLLAHFAICCVYLNICGVGAKVISMVVFQEFVPGYISGHRKFFCGWVKAQVFVEAKVLMCNTFNFEGIKLFLSFSKKEIVEFCSNYLKNVELFTILRVILKLLTVSQVLLRRQPKCLKLGRLPFSTENFKFDLSTGIYGRHIVLKKYYKPFIYYMKVKSGKCNVTNCS